MDAEGSARWELNGNQTETGWGRWHEQRGGTSWPGVGEKTASCNSLPIVQPRYSSVLAVNFNAVYTPSHILRAVNCPSGRITFVSYLSISLSLSILRLSATISRQQFVSSLLSLSFLFAFISFFPPFFFLFLFLMNIVTYEIETKQIYRGFLSASRCLISSRQSIHDPSLPPRRNCCSQCNLIYFLVGRKPVVPENRKLASHGHRFLRLCYTLVIVVRTRRHASRTLFDLYA